MNKSRPVNLDLSTYSFPITALVSITHRVSGCILLVGMLILIWMLDASLESEESFNQLKDTLSSPLVKFIVWGILSALAYHTIAGIKHLIMDMGIGETLEGGIMGSKITVVLSGAIIIAIAGWLIW